MFIRINVHQLIGSLNQYIYSSVGSYDKLLRYIEFLLNLITIIISLEFKVSLFISLWDRNFILRVKIRVLVIKTFNLLLIEMLNIG